MKQSCEKDSVIAASEISRRPFERQTSAMAASGEVNSRMPGSRSSSQCRRESCSSSMRTRQNSATSEIPPCQPTASAAEGISSPASMPPQGTPVCLIEKIRLMRGPVAKRDSRCEAAGLVKP